MTSHLISRTIGPLADPRAYPARCGSPGGSPGGSPARLTEAGAAPGPGRIGRIALLTGLALAAWGASQPSLAQTEAAGQAPEPTPLRTPLQAPLQAEDERHHYQVAAGPLDRALSEFASLAGVDLTMDASLLAGRQSPGLAGRFTVVEAFAELLRGQDLRALRQNNGSFILVRGAAVPAGAGRQDGATALATVTVTGQPIGDGSTEGSLSYTTTTMTSATRLALSMRETPQSVTVITRARMDDQAMTQVRDVMTFTPGVTISATAPYRESYYARGFAIENYTFDGLPVSTNSSRRAMFPSDLAMYDRVEVVRGATGLTQGAGTPSASVNFVRKRPTRDLRASVEGSLGSWNQYGAQVDVSGALNEAGTLRARTVGYFSDSDSFQDVVTEKRQLLYVIGEADLGPNTLLTLSLSNQKNDNRTTYGGLPTAADGSDLRLPRSTYLGNTWNYWDDRTTAAFASIDHRLANRWRLNFSFNRLWGRQGQLRAGVALNDDDQWDQSGGLARVDSDRTSYDLYAEGPFRLLGREHELVIGAAVRNADERNDTAGYWPPVYFARDIDIRNWHHDGVQPASFSVDYHFRSTEKQRGLYATTRLNLADPLKLILGLRVDRYRLETRDDIYDWDTGTWEQYEDRYDHRSQLTRYAGLTYDLGRQHSVYLSYTDIFKPQQYQDANNELIDPIVGKNYELGVKGEYFGGALNASASVFRIDQQNLAMVDGACPFNPNMTCYRAAGLARSEGFDLELQGALSPTWQIGAGYTHVSTEVRRDRDPERIGLRLNTNLPTRQFKLATSWRRPDGGWRAGAAVRWQSTVHYQWTGGDYRTEQKAYAIFDLMLGYQYSRHLDFQFNVSNLFDKVYYRSINAQPVIWGGNTVYGTPRRLGLSARYRF